MNRCLQMLILSAVVCFTNAMAARVSAQELSRVPPSKAMKCDNPFDVNEDQVFTISDLFYWMFDADDIELLTFDLNGDDALSTADLLVLLSLYGTDACEADVNGNGTVDDFDVQVFLLVIFD